MNAATAAKPHKVEWKPFFNVFFTQRRADGRSFRQSASVRPANRHAATMKYRWLGCRHAAGNLHAAAGNGGTDDRCGNDFGFTLVDQHHSHTFTHIGRSQFAKNAAARTIQARLTAGAPIWSKLGCASLMLSPVSSTCLLTKIVSG